MSAGQPAAQDMLRRDPAVTGPTRQPTVRFLLTITALSSRSISRKN